MDLASKASATIGCFQEEAWRSDPNLRLLRAELEAITNPNAAQYNENMFLQDWCHTRLYSNIYDRGDVQFNRLGSSIYFYSISQIQACIHEIVHDFKTIATSFSKAIATLRKLLVEEFVMPRLYDKLIVLYGQDITIENTSKLLNECKVLLSGRKVLAKLLWVIIERNKLVDSVKQMVKLAHEDISMSDSAANENWNGTNGDYTFDEELAQQLGQTIVGHTCEILRLMKVFVAQEGMPGLVRNKTGERVFVFANKDYDKFVRRETNQVRHLLAALRVNL